MPPDAQAVENELEKLLLLRPAADGQAMPWSVTTDMLATSSWAPECNIFACIRHMEAGNLAAVWKELARGRKDVEGLLFPLLSLLAREFRQLWQACAGEKVRFHPSEASAKQQLARRLGPAALARCLGMVMDAELAVKSGRCTPEQSLDKLATDLVALFAAARR